MSRKIKAKDVVTVTAIAGLGYLLLTHGSPGPTGGGGGAGKKEGVTGVIADELGGLGITTPNYTLNLPGAGGGTFVFPDFPEPPPIDNGLVPDPIKKGINWEEIIPDINLNLPAIVGTVGKSYAKTPKPKMGTGTGMFGKVSTFFDAFSLAKIFIQTVVPQTVPDKVQGTGDILTKKGRSTRVKAFREKYKIPKDYSYLVTGKAIKVL